MGRIASVLHPLRVVPEPNPKQVVSRSAPFETRKVSFRKGWQLLPG